MHRYKRKVPEPLLDRIDIYVEVPALPYKKLLADYTGEKSEDIRKRVVSARNIQLERFKGVRIYCNGQMKTKHIKKYCKLTDDAHSLLDTAMQKLGLSTRTHTRILKVSRTIADLEGSENIRKH